MADRPTPEQIAEALRKAARIAESQSWPMDMIEPMRNKWHQWRAWAQMIEDRPGYRIVHLEDHPLLSTPPGCDRFRIGYNAALRDIFGDDHG